jgi:carboxyl-terminal processing protease
MMMRLLLPSLLALAMITSPVYAKRYALVIGNSDYGIEIGRLKNPINDANDMAALLAEKEFNVTKLTNARFSEGTPT